MPSAKTVAAFAIVVLIGYLSYVRFPDACDFPISMKAYYSLVRFINHVCDFTHFLGGSYHALYRFLEFDSSPKDDNVEITTDVFGGVQATIFTPKGVASQTAGPAILYYHGGGWVLGSVELDAGYMKSLAKESGMMIIYPEYRLAPENPYPIPFQDCVSATVDILKRAKEFNIDPKKIIFAGDSAGGNLATAVSLHLQKRADPIKPCMITLLYPVLQMSNFLLPSYQQNTNPPLLKPSQMVHFFLLYMGMHNETNLIGPMSRNLHMEGIESKTFAGKISEDLVPKKFKQRQSEMTAYETDRKARALIAKHKNKLQRHVTDPEFAPLSATDKELKLLPRTHIVTCEYDVLRDDGVILYQRMKNLGMDVTHEHLEFGTHGFLNLHDAFSYDKLDQAFIEMVNTMKDGLRKC